MSSAAVDDYERTKNIGGSSERRKNFKILLAEDNEVNRKVVSMQLKKLGFQCDCAKDGKEAVDMFKGGNYDLILMDLTMPNTDGPTASLQIRSYEEIYRSKKVIIVALTAMVLEGSKEYCKSMGMDEFLQKPLKLERLEKILTTYLLPIQQSG
ncbi:histidine kinase [Heterostelium album PN500]|uniref:Histidine kinase n=1 Tax=Heterostelium pallidum (strain ATCC 26659 / Pp 5 / PN500) TaxID=670386 RepID=D3B3Q2_HETP5|nr:histidine kinase [Heterostelium album PN500]EFA83950.1 histidine kinase [Heterostelium album PN500]|eukprot:XP_020436067.1 histidine kinase [Heterostelium album PN500]